MELSLNNILQSLVPKDKKFFPLFHKASANMLVCAETFQQAMRADSVTRLNAYKRIAELESMADEITHVILRESSVTFLTPIDREDIQELAHTLDDVTDYLNGVAKRMELYKIHQINPVMPLMADEILGSCKELNILLHEMHLLRFTPAVTSSLARIREAEKKVYELFNSAVSALFAKEDNAVEILKQKEILSLLATAADRAEQTASVVEGILLKFK